jgi:hypothetical protein
MQHYQNLGGDSGISAYEISAESITVQFKDGAVYLYNYASPGMADVEEMKSLAERGSGLNAFISTTVKKRYAAKLR